MADNTALVAALRIGLEYAEQVLAERKRDLAGYPHKWQREQDDVDELRAALEAAAQAPEAQPCQHRIADARNAAVQSGYVCLDCGAVFQAADHPAPAVAAQAAPAAVDAAPAEPQRDTLIEAWNEVRKEARALAGPGVPFQRLLVAVEAYAMASVAESAPVQPAQGEQQ